VKSRKESLLGHKGVHTKKVGMDARVDLEHFFRKQNHFELVVKVNKNWRSSESMLKRFGYNL